MHRICARYGVLFIADEVMTGFGRTGTLFASEQANVSPDILCIAKGITGGSIPLAATLCTETIFDAHLSEDRSRTFFHSSSYTANPIACAAAVANLEIWRSEPVIDGIRALAATQAANLAGIANNPRFENARQIGTITAFEFAGAAAGYLADVSLRLRQALLERNVLLRPLGATIYVMPPYCATEADLNHVYAAISEAADEGKA
jgi:adenosylmethionine-8-amino-7-oxononanoate aminotransferase